MDKKKIYNNFFNLNYNRTNEKQKSKARDYIVDSLKGMYKINIAHEKYFKHKISPHSCYNLESKNSDYKVLLTAHYDTHIGRHTYIQAFISRELQNKGPILPAILHLLLMVILTLFLYIFLNFKIIYGFVLSFILVLFNLMGIPLCIPNKAKPFRPAPVHDDNNSGIIALIYIAKLLYEKGQSAKIKLLFTDCEEKGMLGSKLFVQNNFENLKNKIIINLDCVGRGSNIFITFKNNSKLAKELQCFFLSKNINTTLSTKSCSDDKSFQEFGFNSVGLIRGDKDPHGNKLIHWTHTPHDTLDNINIDYITEMIELVTEFIKLQIQ